MRRYWKLIVIVWILLSLALLTAALMLLKSPKKGEAISAVAPIPVNVSRVIGKNIPKTVESLGSLSAVQTVTISSVANGRISNIYFKDGQEVGEGMPIVQLDDAQAKANYDAAVTALNLARTKYQRSKQLINIAISQQEFDQLKADVASKEANVKKELAALNQLEISAPFAGILGAFKFDIGDYVNAGDPLVTLVNTKELQVNYNLPERLLPMIKEGQLVIVQADAYPKEQFYGTVTFISPTINPSTRMVAVQAVLPNPKNLLLPGMFVHVSQRISVQKNAMLVPEQAISADVKGYYVYKVVNHKVAQTYVQVGVHFNGMAQVLRGLEVGDTIVIAGLQKLQDGSVIEIIKNDEQ